MKKNIFYLLFVFVFLSCTDEKNSRKTEVFEIREIGELSTTEYLYSKVLKIHGDKKWYKIGDRKILISCKAKVKAGIDLTAIKFEDIEIDGDEIIIFIPKLKITSFNMDPNSIKTEMADISGFRHNFSQEEKNEILQKGEASIRETLAETGIYKEAEKNVISFLNEFYEQMGFEKVKVVVKGNYEK